MALSVSGVKRIFKHGKKELADPDPGMSPDAVLNFYSNAYPELTTATCSGPEMADGKAMYEFKTTVGTKG